MSEYRCQRGHPRFAGQRCNALLFKGRFEGEIAIRCWRCGANTVLDQRKEYTGTFDTALNRV